MRHINLPRPPAWRCRRRPAALAAAAVALGLALAPSPASGVPATTRSPAAGRALRVICQRPDDSVLRAAPSTRAGAPAAAWLSGDLGQRELGRLYPVLDRHRAAVVGLSRDHAAQELIVVVDASAPAAEVGRLASDLDQLALRRRVALRTSCRPKATLDRVRDGLASMGRRRSAGAMAWALDPAAGRVDVLVADQATRAELERRFGDRVEVAVSSDLHPWSGGRYDDAAPHYGDALLSGAASSPGMCTSNVAFTHNVFGVRVTATAGHCGNAGSQWWSGSRYVGQTVYSTLSPDVSMIYAADQTHTDRLYADPCCSPTLTVTGRAQPRTGEYVCVGGSFTLAYCGIEVINDQATFCPGFGFPCNSDMLQTFAFAIYAGPGDSGGVVFQRAGDTGALVAGLINGGGDAFGGRTVFITKVATIERSLQVTLLTTP